MKKTILFVFYHPFNPSFGGIQRVTDLLAKSLLAKGYKVLYLSLLRNDAAMDYDFPCPVYFFPEADPFSAKNVPFYHQFLHDHSVDVIINQAGTFSASILFLNIGNNSVKTISVLHSNPLLGMTHFSSEMLVTKDHSFMEKLRLLKRILLYPSLKRKTWRRLKRHYRHLSEHSDIVCTLSENYKSDLLLAGFTRLDKVKVIPNPNTFQIKEIEKNKQKELLYVGRLEKSEKRVDRLLKIWEKLYKKFPDWKMYIIGDGEERQNMEAQIRSLSLERVFIEGIQQPEDYYRRASVFCLTSNYEGFPMALAEAMQYGAVPIAFNSFKAATDIILHGKTGFLVKPFDLNQYVEELRLLMNNEERREKMSLEAFNYVQRFDIRLITEQWIDIIDN